MLHTKLFVVAFMSLIFFASDNKAQTNQNIPTLTYSELMQNKKQYLEKTVRIKAIHIYGFEWSFLCDFDCKSRKSETWVEFVSEDELCKGSKRKLKKGSDNFDNKAEVMYVGKLSGGTFGDGAYSFQFLVSCVENFKKIKVDLK